jgi:hypothetical protein
MVAREVDFVYRREGGQGGKDAEWEYRMVEAERGMDDARGNDSGANCVSLRRRHYSVHLD